MLSTTIDFGLGLGHSRFCRHPATLPTLNAHHLPGVCKQQVLQLHSQNHCPHAGGDAYEFSYLILTVKETCNLLIDMARKFLDPTSIFQIEVGMHVLYLLSSIL